MPPLPPRSCRLQRWRRCVPTCSPLPPAARLRPGAGSAAGSPTPSSSLLRANGWARQLPRPARARGARAGGGRGERAAAPQGAWRRRIQAAPRSLHHALVMPGRWGAGAGVQGPRCDEGSLRGASFSAPHTLPELRVPAADWPAAPREFAAGRAERPGQHWASAHQQRCAAEEWKQKQGVEDVHSERWTPSRARFCMRSGVAGGPRSRRGAVGRPVSRCRAAVWKTDAGGAPVRATSPAVGSWVQAGAPGHGSRSRPKRAAPAAPSPLTSRRRGGWPRGWRRLHAVQVLLLSP